MENNDEILTKFFLKSATATTLELTSKKSNKEFKIKHNNRGSITGSLTGANWRSPSVNKERSTHDHDNSYNEYHTTSLENLDLHGSKTKVAKLL